MTLTLTAAAPPVFLSGNYITRFADTNLDLIVSSGVALRNRFYDMDPAAYWLGENADDTIDEVLTAGLWIPGMQSEQSIDFLAILNHNLKAFDWEFSDDNGATYPGANKQSKTLQTASDSIINLAATVAADKIKLTMHSTFAATPNAYKQVGAVVAAKVKFQPSVGMSLFKPHPFRQKDRSAKMHDNSTRRSYVLRSDASTYFTDFSIGFTGLTSTEADSLIAILLGTSPFIFYPQPNERSGKMYLGSAVPGTVVRMPTSASGSGGEIVTFDFEEAGGA